MTVNYEWDVEEVTAIESAEHEEDEVIDHQFCKSFAEVKAILATTPRDGMKFVPVLVRDDDDCRAWAYMEDGQLPGSFEDAYGNPVAKVPKKFIAEVARA